MIAIMAGIITGAGLYLLTKYVEEKERQEQIQEIDDRLFELSNKDEIPAMEAQTALEELKNHLLGEHWYIVAPLGVKQINYWIVFEIEKMYKRVK